MRVAAAPLKAFMSEVDAQRGKAFSAEVAEVPGESRNKILLLLAEA